MGDVELSFTRAMLVNQELSQELGRKTSLEARGITVVTASGVLVTLAFGFSAAVAKGHSFGNFTPPEKILLGVALGFFIISSYFGLLTNTPRNYAVLKLETLLRSKGRPFSPPAPGFRYRHKTVVPRSVYGTPDEPISEDTLTELVKVLDATRRANRNKAQALLICMTLQLIAVFVLSATVIVVVV